MKSETADKGGLLVIEEYFRWQALLWAMQAMLLPHPRGHLAVYGDIFVCDNVLGVRSTLPLASSRQTAGMMLNVP